MADPRRPLRTRLALAVATAGGVGWTPVAPGTAGTALAAALLGVAAPSLPGRVAVLAGIVVVGTWAAGHAARALGARDPGAIVIDEVAGMALTVLPFSPTIPVLAAGFVLFRVFDIVKPPPARAAERLPGGLGVMLDDLVAGLWALGALAILRWGLGWR